MTFVIRACQNDYNLFTALRFRVKLYSFFPPNVTQLQHSLQEKKKKLWQKQCLCLKTKGFEMLMSTQHQKN